MPELDEYRSSWSVASSFKYVSNHREFYIHSSYLYVCVYMHIYTCTHVKYIFHRDVLLKEIRLNVFTI